MAQMACTFPLLEASAEFTPLSHKEMTAPGAIVPWCPSPVALVEDLVALAQLSERDVFVDIGCGDGELLLRAAAASGCSVHGYDISETLISTATAKAAARSLSSRAHFARASFLDPSFALPEGTTVVYLYLLDHALEKLRDILQLALVRGVRIVSNQFHPEFLGRPSGGATEREGRWDLRLFRRPASA